MKYIIHIVLAISIISCSNNIKEKQIFGDQNITEEGKISGLELLNTLASNDSAQVKVEAKINSICQKKGCWMYVDLGDTTEMLVRFKEYEFFVPMDATDKIAMIEGMAKVDTLSVEWQKHLKEDANAFLLSAAIVPRFLN